MTVRIEDKGVNHAVWLRADRPIEIELQPDGRRLKIGRTWQEVCIGHCLSACQQWLDEHLPDREGLHAVILPANESPTRVRR